MTGILGDKPAESPAFTRGILPPYRVDHDILDEETIAEMLDLAIAREAEFYESMTWVGANPLVRVSRSVNDLGRFGRSSSIASPSPHRR
jgi:hypothetical protein